MAQIKLSRRTWLVVVPCGAIIVILWSIVSLHVALVQAQGGGSSRATPPTYMGNVTDVLVHLGSTLDSIAALVVGVEKDSQQSLNDLTIVFASHTNKTRDMRELAKRVTCNDTTTEKLPPPVTFPSVRMPLLGPLHGIPLLVWNVSKGYLDHVLKMVANTSSSDDTLHPFRVVVCHQGWADVAPYLINYPIAAHIVHTPSQNDTFEWWSLITAAAATNRSAVVVLDASIAVTQDDLEYFQHAEKAMERDALLGCVSGSPDRCHGIPSTTILHRTETVSHRRGIAVSTLWLREVSGRGAPRAGNAFEEWLQLHSQRGTRECLYMCLRQEMSPRQWDALFDAASKPRYDDYVADRVKNGHPTSYTTIRELQHALSEHGIIETLQNGIPMFSYNGVSVVYDAAKNGTETFFVNRLRYAFGN